MLSYVLLSELQEHRCSIEREMKQTEYHAGQQKRQDLRSKGQDFNPQLRDPKDELKHSNYGKENLLDPKLSQDHEERSSKELHHPDLQNPKGRLTRR